ncbi:MAG: HAD hydrolase family protein [Eubacteriales bacterium]|nr:HAD hydrolase family protein [Eubacteriales bacterium]
MNNQAIRMVFVDLDGTLLRGVNTVTQRTREAFRKIKEAGIIPVICRGDWGRNLLLPSGPSGRIDILLHQMDNRCIGIMKKKNSCIR